jgi:hypothetical protein
MTAWVSRLPRYQYISRDSSTVVSKVVNLTPCGDRIPTLLYSSVELKHSSTHIRVSGYMNSIIQETQFWCPRIDIKIMYLYASIDITILYWPAVNSFNDLIQFLPTAHFHLTPKIHFSLVYVILWNNKNDHNKLAGFTARQTCVLLNESNDTDMEIKFPAFPVTTDFQFTQKHLSHTHTHTHIYLEGETFLTANHPPCWCRLN